jgi:hypothetical protein
LKTFTVKNLEAYLDEIGDEARSEYLESFEDKRMALYRFLAAKEKFRPETTSLENVLKKLKEIENVEDYENAADAPSAKKSSRKKNPDQSSPEKPKKKRRKPSSKSTKSIDVATPKLTFSPQKKLFTKIGNEEAVVRELFPQLKDAKATMDDKRIKLIKATGEKLMPETFERVFEDFVSVNKGKPMPNLKEVELCSGTAFKSIASNLAKRQELKDLTFTKKSVLTQHNQAIDILARDDDLDLFTVRKKYSAANRSLHSNIDKKYKEAFAKTSEAIESDKQVNLRLTKFFIKLVVLEWYRVLKEELSKTLKLKELVQCSPPGTAPPKQRASRKKTANKKKGTGKKKGTTKKKAAAEKKQVKATKKRFNMANREKMKDLGSSIPKKMEYLKTFTKTALTNFLESQGVDVKGKWDYDNFYDEINKIKKKTTQKKKTTKRKGTKKKATKRKGTKKKATKKKATKKKATKRKATKKQATKRKATKRKASKK